jgi:allophanate hydrolase subunit 2
MEPQSLLNIAKGQRVRIGVPKSGWRVAIATPGGWKIHNNLLVPKPILLHADLIANASAQVRIIRLSQPPSSLEQGPFRILVRRTDRLDLESSSWVVNSRSNRVGLRLEGPVSPHQEENESEPAIPGSIQIDRSGVPIILGVDGPTIGGYPQIANVATVDLNRLAQQRPGSTIQFQSIDLNQAEQLNTNHQTKLHRQLQKIKLAL